jgi:tetratricopeptide (TPR) repeat protein
MFKSALIILLCIYAQYAAAQQKQIDSLKTKVLTAKNDTVKARTYYVIAQLYIAKPDSAFAYIRKGQQLSEKAKYALGIGLAKFEYGYVYNMMGNYPIALKMLLAALQDMNKLGNNEMAIQTLRLLASIYDDQGDERKAITYTEESLKISEKVHNVANLSNGYSAIAYYYNKLHEYSTALRYCQIQEKKIGNKPPDAKWLAVLYCYYGDAYAGLKQYDKGMMYWHKSIKHNAADDAMSQWFVYTSMAKHFEEVNKLDSARYYGVRALGAGKAMAYNVAILDATQRLARVTAKSDKNASIAYYEEATKLNKLMFDAEKTREVQNITLNEQQRQQDLIAEQERVHEETDREPATYSYSAVYPHIPGNRFIVKPYTHPSPGN